MFGHNNNDTNGDASTAQHGSDTPVDGAPGMGGLGPETIAPTASSSAPTPAAPADDNAADNDNGGVDDYVIADLPGTAPVTAPPVTPPPAPAPATVPPPAPAPVSTPSSTSLSSSELAAANPATYHTPATDNARDTSGSTSAANMGGDVGDAEDLLELKQSALHDLSPLLGQLDQSPEERFRTTMMMIQATDDHAMLQAAYDAARSITDEKARAQALLDVVNEINYFTQANATTSL